MTSSASQATLFSLLPKTKTPWTEFVLSTGTQALAIAFLAWVRLLHPAVFSPPEHIYHSIGIVSTPAPVDHQPQPLTRLKPVIVAYLDRSPNALRLPAPLPKAPAKVEDAPAPTVSIATKKPETLPINSAPVIPKQAVKMNVFTGGSSATPTTARAASQVQTGGFGDPNGIPAKAGPGKPANIAALGSFDLPSGPGSGNGTAGAKGVPGVVVSSGFGNGTATADNHPHTAATVVQSSGFASADVAAPPTVHSRSGETATKVLPAEILSKPTPVYTQEAKNLRIEGEVLLEVVLEASGSLRIVRVVRGLGHGLDDNAVKAAEQIHFKPAMKDGQPSDSTVVLHIIFQLA
jgi:TonB family protein